ncbi:AraC family transcriptional regulator [Pseudoalteromonas fenneropenaei]|uniref:AraC family transcriptional regulator n=1 Tax=Pseudoalteromonas fenneropenaei TaxID=1737459 RepID=A0ABV7CLE1_9GAMM
MHAWDHVKPHQHPWGQLAYCSNGVLTMVTDAGTFVVPPQQALWLPAGVWHESYCRYGGDFRSVYIDLSYQTQLGENTKLLHVDALLREMILEICRWPEDYALTPSTLRFVDVFIDRLQQAPSSHFFIPKPQDPRLALIISELHAHPGCTKTLEQWAEIVGASSRTLNRLFHQSFTMSFRLWKQNLRALRAVELLTEGQSQQRIAEQLGFASSAAFNSAFKKVFGTSPGRYLTNGQK